MDSVKYVCPKCFYEQEKPGMCPNCNVELIATCTVCGNPVVGEHVHLET